MLICICGGGRCDAVESYRLSLISAAKGLSGYNSELI